MGVVADLVTGGPGLGDIASLAKDIIDRVAGPDKAQAEKDAQEFMLKAEALDSQLAAGQLAINQVEAASNSLFVSGWRPFIGWACGAAFVYHLILQPVLAFALANTGHEVKLPDFDTSTLTTTLMGMLGLGVLRTTEKLADKGNLPWQQ